MSGGFLHVKAPRPGRAGAFTSQQVKYVNCNALSMFKALNKGCKKKMRSFTFKPS